MQCIRCAPDIEGLGDIVHLTLKKEKGKHYIFRQIMSLMGDADRVDIGQVVKISVDGTC